MGRCDLIVCEFRCPSDSCNYTNDGHRWTTYVLGETGTVIETGNTIQVLPHISIHDGTIRVITKCPMCGGAFYGDMMIENGVAQYVEELKEWSDLETDMRTMAKYGI